MEPMSPYRVDVLEMFDLEIRWVHVPCLYDTNICPIREHIAGVISVIGEDSWCGFAHGAAMHSPQQEDDALDQAREEWAALQRASAAFGMPWRELTPATVLAQITLALQMSNYLWDELMLWDLEHVPLMVRRGRKDLYVVPQLLRCTGWYRIDTGGSNRPVSVSRQSGDEDDAADEWGDAG